MKSIVSLAIAVFMFSQVALAECDFSKGITPGPNKTYVYSEECHIKVGQLVQSNETKDRQIADLTKAIELKDLAITKADQRTQLWMDTSYKMEERITKIDELQSKNNTLYYALGILTVVAAAYVVNATHH